MTPKQTAAFRGNYHATFGKLCEQFDLPKTSAQRHQLTEWVLGYSKSSSKFTAKEYAIVIDQLKEWIAGDVEPHALTRNEQGRKSHDERHKQLVHVIEALSPEAYTQAIANNRHGQRPWRQLTTLQLTRLRFTLESRAAAKHRQGKTLKS
ncbi:hypothetical protein ACWPKS_15780 [Coraliomargarita sp. W4R72]